jgi:hypothetical protein
MLHHFDCVSLLYLDPVSCAWLVTIPLEAALHLVLHGTFQAFQTISYQPLNQT